MSDEAKGKHEGQRSSSSGRVEPENENELTLLTSVRLENDSFSKSRSEELVVLFGVVGVKSVSHICRD